MSIVLPGIEPIARLKVRMPVDRRAEALWTRAQQVKDMLTHQVGSRNNAHLGSGAMSADRSNEHLVATGV